MNRAVHQVPARPPEPQPSAGVESASCVVGEGRGGAKYNSGPRWATVLGPMP